jgi:hypothetical protein
LGARAGGKKGKNIFWQEYWGNDVGLLVAAVAFWISDVSSSPSVFEIIFLPLNILAPRHPRSPSLQRQDAIAVGGGQGQHQEVQVVVHDRETADTRGEALAERQQPIFDPLSSRILPLGDSITTIVIPSNSPT